MKLRTPFTAEALRTWLYYNPKTGVWRWLTGEFRGLPAGWLDRHGYRKIGIARQQYKASRLAVLYMTGHWPPGWVDHKDNDPANERWNNIRLATYSQNAWNRRGWSTKNKLKGAYHYGKKWRAIIGFKNKTIHLGTFNTEQEAHAAYWRAAKKYHGEYARAA